ncbi:MAG: alanine--tRNA ligase [Bacteroidetes bacterium]|nr:alanine--tRNA ligase [Bacteroidota bacterium]
MNSKDVRNSFLEFFRKKDHTIVPSSSVVPFNDPTLLFTNAGMNQFKDVFLGTGTRDYSRAADTQKCIRAGGKHNDLEEVGMDGYHHTFFEMLGNWSFGDYYKKEAIKWAWELLTDVWKLPKDKLWVTVFETDEEAFTIWSDETDIDKSHILRFGEKDNFWEMGDTGPCGPCSEIHFDFTENGCKPEDVNSGHEEVIEIWNLVFIQYNRKNDGELEPLPKKHVDTGMGFERIVRVLQNKKSNYDTDVFTPLISKITGITGKDYSGENISSINAIADHIRSLVFAISDGAVPSNEGRGYVLRRILRRASRLARKLDYNGPILFQLVDTLVDNCGGVFPELTDKKDFCKMVIKSEEESFHVTLDRGIKLFNDVADTLTGTKIFPGDEAFKLYDTFGFPLDLTEVMAKERGLKVDLLKFAEDMEKQKERGKSGRKDLTAGTVKAEESYGKFDTVYDPYSITSEGVETFSLIPEKETSKNIIVLGRNPFFSESGGQISDTGSLVRNGGQQIRVLDSKKDFIVVENIPADLSPDEKVTAKIDFERRNAIQRNHSATHIVHEALKRVLGSHVKQLGSLVADEYLRFDFPHFSKPDNDQLNEIEDMVNSKIAENLDVITHIDIPVSEANKIPNVKKFFGDKYGEKVRVVVIDESFSAEFCGGTHVMNTQNIGLFRITKEESIASGTRRIFARTGEGIIHFLGEKISELEKIISELPEKYAGSFRTGLTNFRNDVSKSDFLNAERMRSLLKYQDKTHSELTDLKEKYSIEKKAAEKELLKQRLKIFSDKLDQLILTADKEKGFDILSVRMDMESMDELKESGEEMRKKIKNGVGLIASVMNDKINIVCSVSDNLIREKGLNAGKIISAVAKELGGGGGGKPHLASAGAKDTVSLDRVLKEFPGMIKGLIK